ncbi:MAG: hypothetical protein COS71_03485 [Candidatus Moranbacteria bacterium CG06_land_8_20_14_3_00_40_12]|nr:MAG: hypothetical protein COX31_03145 [Candidatus Moranbacteria bacterium CG23_combo_of_CG06-09_8_20_14_all_40_16]PIU80422.1 MAG: hypothetical protein COS71_03485 [Candidatus Moranbacteria bacterium CG06_land_8_20_14_3_00_40_12]
MPFKNKSAKSAASAGRQNSVSGGKEKKLSGMSLIETILYLGIAVFALGAIFLYGWNVMEINIKSQVTRETAGAAQLIEERLKYEIRKAESVDRTASVFGETPAKLVLQEGDETVEIEDAGNQITVKRGSADPVLWHSPDIRIENFVFTEQVSGTDETDYVGFSFDAVAGYPGSSTRSEYQYALSFRSGSALRNSH